MYQNKVIFTNQSIFRAKIMNLFKNKRIVCRFVRILFCFYSNLVVYAEKC